MNRTATPDLERLHEQAQQLRRDVVRMVHRAGDGHPGPALSIADIVAALYFHVLRIDPARPDWPERDRLILSKGHACPVVYAALCRRGFFCDENLQQLRCLGSILQGHPDMNKTPGIDMTSGSLGNGISVGLGMALAGIYQGRDYHTYVIVGDGELQEGIIWESAMSAVRYNVGRLTVLVDENGLQSGGAVSEISGLQPIMPKWQGFGWHCQEIDGHDMGQILHALDAARDETARPSVIIAHTTKGKGVPFMENDNSWHKRTPTADELERALAALGGGENDAEL
jgi:transketolase